MRGPLRSWTKTEIPKPGGRLTVSAGETTRVGHATGVGVAVSRVGVKVGVSELLAGCAKGDDSLSLSLVSSQALVALRGFLDLLGS